MRIHVGVQHLSSIVRFDPQFEVVELTRMMYSRYREATLKNLVTKAPEGTRFVTAVPQAIADPEWAEPTGGVAAASLRGFLPGPELEAQILALHRAAGLVRSQTLLIRTPVSFRPTALNIERLGQFAQHPKWKNQRVVWQADGLWDPARVAQIAASFGITPVQDPLVTPVAPAAAEFAYFRVRGATPTRLIPEMSHLELLEACRPYKRIFLVFCTSNPVQDARNFMENAGLSDT